MSSCKSRLFIFLLKNRHWFQGRLKREVIDWNTDISALRARVEKTGAMLGKTPAHLEIEPAPADGVYGEFIRLPGADPKQVIMYFHGGGYVLGNCRMHRRVVAKFVTGSGLNAYCFDYSLAPEHPFPAALEDALQVYGWLLGRGFAAENIVLAGDSAGAGLLLALLLALKDQGLPLPRAAAALSPWTDLTCSGASHQKLDPLAPQGSWEVYGKYYAGDHDPTLPLISPLYGDLAGLPPLYLSVGDNENLLDDSVALADKARAAGVEVTLAVGRGMVHCYPALAPLFTEASQALEAICAFLAAGRAGA